MYPFEVTFISALANYRRDALKSYQVAYSISETELELTDQVRLDVAYNYAVFINTHLNNRVEYCKLVEEALDEMVNKNKEDQTKKLTENINSCYIHAVRNLQQKSFYCKSLENKQE